MRNNGGTYILKRHVNRHVFEFKVGSICACRRVCINILRHITINKCTYRHAFSKHGHEHTVAMQRQSLNRRFLPETRNLVNSFLFSARSFRHSSTIVWSYKGDSCLLTWRPFRHSITLVCSHTEDPSVQHKEKKNGHDNTIAWLLVVLKAASALHHMCLKSQRWKESVHRTQW